MASLAQLHAALKTNLATITGLRVLDVTEQTTAPCVKVGPANEDPVTWPHTFSKPGDMHAMFAVRAFHSISSPRSALTQIYKWMDGAGSESLRVALESDTTLGGLVANQGMQVHSPSSAGLIDDPAGTFFGFDLAVEVIYTA